MPGLLYKTLLFPACRLQARPHTGHCSLLQCLPELRDGVALGDAEEGDAAALRLCRADKVLAWDFRAGEGDGLCGRHESSVPTSLTRHRHPAPTPPPSTECYCHFSPPLTLHPSTKTLDILLPPTVSMREKERKEKERGPSQANSPQHSATRGAPTDHKPRNIQPRMSSP